ncbi:hypothetical protein A6A19_02555 [Actinobacillus delphinicola]|uniref:AIPR family protein n=1 Tax=Actinobacillus delphinicola TaxID=51161 RepID=UPI0024418DD0|nr:AIPR family protein [Actinobacillus delphinicola]MDG6896908.1 hypothetical protein [Actinobacillus delphinicola]
MTIDRVTKAYLKQFSENYNFIDIDESLLFEHFVNYTLVSPLTNHRIIPESINIGENGTQGIDGFAILLNSKLIENFEDLDEVDLLGINKVEFIFIQAKISSEMDYNKINGFGNAVSDFISKDPQYTWPCHVLEKIKLFNKILDIIPKAKTKPKLRCLLYYVTLANNSVHLDTSLIRGSCNLIKDSILRESIFTNEDINIQMINAESIRDKYNKIGRSIEKNITFKEYVLLPNIEGVKESYLGYIRGHDLISLIKNDDDDSLISEVFYDNVRDYQGNNKVNSEIKNTLQSNNKDSFILLNNGITIVAENCNRIRDTITLSNYQIINGCQTSHVLYTNKDKIDDNVNIPLKLIITENEDITLSIIKSTNSQTEIKDYNLIAFTRFQKSLEEFYDAIDDEDKLYYERRSKQFEGNQIDHNRIIDIKTQIKSIASLYYNRPHDARYFKRLFEWTQDHLFKDNDELYPYYIASLAYYKLDSAFKTKRIDMKYKKIKFHILMMLGKEIHSSRCPDFKNKKQINKYCNTIKEILDDDKKLMAILNNIVKKIDGLNVDLLDSDLSKEKEFVDKCLSLYH